MSVYSESVQYGLFCSLSNDPFYSSNVKSFVEAIDLTSAATDGGGYIAVKPTALCSPDLWVGQHVQV